MKKKDTTLAIVTVIAVTAIIVAVILYHENQKKKERIFELEEDNLKLILDWIKSNETISEEIQSQLTKLVEDFKPIDSKVSNELVQAIQLYQIGQRENAIEDLVKIIEHLLTIHYKDNEEFISWLKERKKQVSLHNQLEFCKHEKKISQIEYQFFVAIKTIRNKEDHTLDLTLDDHINYSGLIAAIGGIMKLSNIVYPQTL